MAKLSVPLRFTALEAVPRRGEPVTVGLPWPKGAVRDTAEFSLRSPGATQELQTQVLARWADGSIRWCLFDFLATWDGASVETGYAITTGAELKLAAAPLEAVSLPPPRLTIVDGQGNHHDRILIFESHDAEPCTLRARCKIRSSVMAGLNVCGFVEVWPHSQAAFFHLTVCNPAAADHPGGNWDLGSPGSILLHSLQLHWDFSCNVISTSLERGTASQSASRVDFHQHSSGGENWQSSNHLDRNRKIPHHIRGYRATLDDRHLNGLRATPAVQLRRANETLGLAVPHFWENFPCGVAADAKGLRYWLLGELDELHEFQGGEQKTFQFTLSFGGEPITAGPLAWARSPIAVVAPPVWYVQAGALDYLTEKAGDPHTDYLALVDQALDGPDTFLRKREAIDEYGWRHFGDLWGDHEAVDHAGPAPMISHDNNQYDCVLGFLIQYLRSGDMRWLGQGLECADHTCDIDIYHTELDKAAYNGGLFWHTYHYAEADTGTHRSYPKSLRNAQHFESGQNLDALGKTGQALKKNYAIGGGPAAAHNYNHGLMLAFYLTGNPNYRASAIGLADYVLHLDDGRKTIFRWLSRRDTGLAIQSSSGYLGPGRASANSLLALLAAHRLTGESKYLDKAHQIVRRVVHPYQNLERLDLLNAELRWFYTMFLQALGSYLDDCIERGRLDEDYAYARLSLLHYVRYMAIHERPILSQPEKLQYPTETWAAQDLRKVEVFQFAAKHAHGEERERFLERAEWFFRESATSLDRFPPTVRGIATKSLCRPVILCMNHGWSRAWWRRHPDTAAPLPDVNVDVNSFGEWSMYRPQKDVAVRRAKILFVISAVIFSLAAFSMLLKMER